jgi:flagellar assembly factor FliW
MMLNNVAISELEPEVAAGSAMAESIVVDTRFGRLEFDPAQSISMPRGMMGFPDDKVFALTSVPDPRVSNFMLFQSLTDSTLSFLTLPLSLENGPHDIKDLEAARQDLGIDSEDFAAIGIVSIRNIAGKAQTSVNLRAPVFLDARNRTAWQYVLPNGAYNVRHLLTSLDEIVPAAPIK